MMSCLNCQAPLDGGQGKIYHSVFCCPTCFDKAKRLEARLNLELTRMQTLLKESIRVALVEGKLKEMAHPEDIPKGELLQAIVSLQDKRGK